VSLGEFIPARCQPLGVARSLDLDGATRRDEAEYGARRR
jgi:hypothetical protein